MKNKKKPIGRREHKVDHSFSYHLLFQYSPFFNPSPIKNKIKVMEERRIKKKMMENESFPYRPSRKSSFDQTAKAVKSSPTVIRKHISFTISFFYYWPPREGKKGNAVNRKRKILVKEIDPPSRSLPFSLFLCQPEAEAINAHKKEKEERTVDLLAV